MIFYFILIDAYNSEQLQLELLTEKRDPVTFGKPFLIAKFILEKYELVKGTLDHGVSGIQQCISFILYVVTLCKQAND